MTARGGGWMCPNLCSAASCTQQPRLIFFSRAFIEGVFRADRIHMFLGIGFRIRDDSRRWLRACRWRNGWTGLSGRSRIGTTGKLRAERQKVSFQSLPWQTKPVNQMLRVEASRNYSVKSMRFPNLFVQIARIRGPCPFAIPSARNALGGPMAESAIDSIIVE